MNKLAVTATILLSILFIKIHCCYLWGTDSGECKPVLEISDPAWKLSNMPYCGEVVNYPVCTPKGQVSVLNCKIPSLAIIFGA
jgi:hypothetical protein